MRGNETKALTEDSEGSQKLWDILVVLRGPDALTDEYEELKDPRSRTGSTIGRSRCLQSSGRDETRSCVAGGSLTTSSTTTKRQSRRSKPSSAMTSWLNEESRSTMRKEVR